MEDRAQLILIAQQKFERDQLISQAREKAVSEYSGGQSIMDDFAEADKMPKSQAAQIGLERGVSFGFRPAIKGAAAGLGSFIGNIEQRKKGEGLSSLVKRSLQAVPAAYQEGRQEALSEEALASKDRPGYMLGGDIAGNVLTAPLVPIKGLRGALALGAAQGTGRAVSEAESLKEAGQKIAEGAAYGGAGFGIAKGLERGAKVLGPQIKVGIGKVSDFMSDKNKAVFAKTASALTGESEKNIKNFVSKNAEINKIISDSGGDISSAADTMRETLSKQIQHFRQSMGQKIGDALENVSPDKNVAIKDVVSGLERMKSRINIKLDPEQSGQIDDIISKVMSLADESGNVSLKELHQVQQFLSERATGSYLKGGQMFVPGKVSKQAAKAGAREAKIILDKLAPEIKEANTKLFQLHKIEDNINKNLIAPGKNEAALLAAGGASSGRNRKFLESLGGILGKDVVGEAEKLSAAAAFINPSLLPKSAGGTTSTSRTILGGLIGGTIAGPVGSAIGAALTSPMALKHAINAGVVSKQVLDKVVGKSVEMTERGLSEAIRLVNTPQGLSAISRLSSQQLPGGAIDRRLKQLVKPKDNVE